MVLVRATVMSPMMPNRRRVGGRVFGGGARRGPRQSRCIAQARYVGTHNTRLPGHRRAGKPDSSDHSSARTGAAAESAPIARIVSASGRHRRSRRQSRDWRRRSETYPKRRHAPIVACEGAVAQSRKFVALNAERIPRADRVRGKRASPACSKRDQNDVTHGFLLVTSRRRSRPSFDSFGSTHVCVHCVDEPGTGGNEKVPEVPAAQH